jgi:hypothetical protein
MIRLVSTRVRQEAKIKKNRFIIQHNYFLARYTWLNNFLTFSSLQKNLSNCEIGFSFGNDLLVRCESFSTKSFFSCLETGRSRGG